MRKRGRAPPAQEVFSLGGGGSSRDDRSVSRMAFKNSKGPNSGMRKPGGSEQRSVELVGAVLEALFQKKEEPNFANPTVHKLVNDAVTTLCQHPAEPNRYIFLSVAHLCKILPQVYTASPVVRHLCKVLSTAPNTQEGSQFSLLRSANVFVRNPAVPLLCASVLYQAHAALDVWPLVFVQSYMEDAFASRVWVQHEATKLFVLNVLTALPISRTAASAPEEDRHFLSACACAGIAPESVTRAAVWNRYKNVKQRNRIEKFVVDMLEYHVQQDIDNERGFIRVLCGTATIAKSRVIGSSFVGGWFANSALVRPAKDYLMTLATETHEATVEDIETIHNILAMKLKSMHHQTQLECLSKLLENNPEYPVIALRYLFTSQLLASGGQNTLSTEKTTARIVIALLKASRPETQLEHHMACMLQDLAVERKLALPLLPMLRRFFAIAGQSIDHSKLCESLAADRADLRQEGRSMDAWVEQIVNFFCLSVLYCIPPQVLQEYNSKEADKTAAMAQLLVFKHRVSSIQSSAVTWCHEVLPHVLGVPDLYMGVVRKLLFMDRSQVYLTLAELGNETYEKHLVHALFNEMPVKESTATRLVLITISNLPLQPKVALDMLHTLVYRAAKLQAMLNKDFASLAGSTMNQALLFTNAQLADIVLKLSIYQPALGVEAPHLVQEANRLAIVQWFWQAAIILLILGSFNPESIGAYLWQNLPPVRALMRMCITRLPAIQPVDPQTAHGQREQQKKQILHVENMIAQLSAHGQPMQEITAATSAMLNQLMMYPVDPLVLSAVNLPPEAVLKNVKDVSHEFLLGASLCRSRQPDFLLEIMEKEGTESSLLWLVPMVSNDTSALENLPASALCQLLLSFLDNAQDGKAQSPQLAKVLEMLRGVLRSTDPIEVMQLLRLLLTNLSGPSSTKRSAKRALCLLFQSAEDGEAATPSLYESLAALARMPILTTYMPDICVLVYAAVDAEEDVETLMAYVRFLGSDVKNRAQTPAEVTSVSSRTAQALSRALHRHSVLSVQLLKDATLSCLAMECFLLCLQDPTLLALASSDAVARQTVIDVMNAAICLLSSKPAFSGSGEEGDATRFATLTQEAATVLFTDGKIQAALATGSDNVQIVSEDTAVALARSNNPRLYEIGVSHLRAPRLLTLLSAFGLEVAVVRLIVARLTVSADLDQAVLELPSDAMARVESHLRLYESMGLEEATSLLAKIKAPASVPAVEPRGSRLVARMRRLMVGTAPQRPAPDADMADLVDVAALVGQLLRPDAADAEQAGGQLADYLLPCPGPTTQQMERTKEVLLAVEAATKPGAWQPAPAAQKGLSGLLLALGVNVQLFQRRKQGADSAAALLRLLRVLQDAFRSLPGTAFWAQLASQVLTLEGKVPDRRELRRQGRLHTVCCSTLPGKLTIATCEETLASASASDILAFLGRATATSVLFEDALSLAASVQPRATLSALPLLLESLPLQRTETAVRWVRQLVSLTSPVITKDNTEIPLYEWLLTTTCPAADDVLAIALEDCTWEELRTALAWLAACDEAKLSVTRALDFAAGCTYHRQSWLGYTRVVHGSSVASRRTATEVAQPFFGHLPLALMQLLQLAIREAVENGGTRLAARGQLVLDWLSAFPAELAEVVKFLLARTGEVTLAGADEDQVMEEADGSAKESASAAADLLVKVYLHFPTNVQAVLAAATGERRQSASHLVQLGAVAALQPCRLDALIHKLLKQFLDPQAGERAFHLLQSIALSHPALTLRHLPAMTALLQGRAQLSLQQFIQRGYHRAFSSCLSIAAILRPAVFDHHALGAMLQCFFDLFANGQTLKSNALAPMLYRFVDFLYFYLPTDDKEFRLLASNAWVLEGICAELPQLAKLPVILHCISEYERTGQLDRTRHHDWDAAIEEYQVHEIRRMLQRRQEHTPVPTAMHPPGAPVLSPVDMDLHRTLVELQRVTYVEPELLGTFLHELVDLVRYDTAEDSAPAPTSASPPASPQHHLRVTALALLQRFLESAPGTPEAEFVVRSLLRILEETSGGVRQDVLQHSAEFYDYSGPLAASYLLKLFSVGRPAAAPLQTIASRLAT